MLFYCGITLITTTIYRRGCAISRTLYPRSSAIFTLFLCRYESDTYTKFFSIRTNLHATREISSSDMCRTFIGDHRRDDRNDGDNGDDRNNRNDITCNDIQSLNLHTKRFITTFSKQIEDSINI